MTIEACDNRSSNSIFIVFTLETYVFIYLPISSIYVDKCQNIDREIDVEMHVNDAKFEDYHFLSKIKNTVTKKCTCSLI